MSETVIVALITAATSALVAITALILNYRGFASIDARFASLETSVSGRFAALESSVNGRVAALENSVNGRVAALENSVNGRVAALESSMNSRFASVEQRLNIIQTDLKEFYRVQAEHDKRISRLEDRADS